MSLVWLGQQVPYARFSQDNLRVTGIRFQFFPQAADINLEAVRRLWIILTPHRFSKARVGYYSAGISQKVMKDRTLSRSETYLLLPIK